MKTFLVLAVAVVLCSSFPVVSQKVGGSAQQSSSVSTPGAQAGQSASASAQASRQGASAQGSVTGDAAATNRLGSSSASGQGSGNSAVQMTPVNGELVGKLDSKTARVGDPVVMKTTQKARTADGREIPKGSKLIGHVTDVKAHGGGSQDSELGLAFDRAELRNGESMAIHSVIESVSPSAAAANAAAAGEDDTFASGPALGSTAAGGGAMGVRSGGGLAGGGSRGVLGGASPVAGGTVSAVGAGVTSADAGLGSAAHGTLGAAGGTAVNAGHGALTGAGAGSLGTHATGVPGVMLGADGSGGGSGILSASNRNVHLDNGTQMVLRVSSALEK